MIMKILTTMRNKLIIISILYPLVKLMTISELLELFESFNTTFYNYNVPLSLDSCKFLLS